MKNYLFTSESVSEGHPDKMADQISDSVLDAFLAQDPQSRVACETLLTTGLIVVSGEVTTRAQVDVTSLVRDVVRDIGYDDASKGFDASTCGVILAMGRQSPDIAMGVDTSEIREQGAGDQGIMFGYAVNETAEQMPLSISLSHALVRNLASDRKNGKVNWLRPDSKSQVTVEYENGKAKRVDAVVISTQHSEDVSQETIKQFVMDDVIKRSIPTQWLDSKTKFFINPTGRFVIGGPMGDCGLTGRKIIVDTYGGHGAHGGGAFSGKDPSKVDRSAAYASRHIAKNIVAAGLAEKCLIQVSYAIGVAKPCGLFINTHGTAKVNMTDGEIAKKCAEIFDMRPYAIEQRLKLRSPMYSETAAYGHMGRKNEVVKKTFTAPDGTQIVKEVELFTWEKLDFVDKVKSAFSL